MTISKDQAQPRELLKRTYSAPRLSIFGSVRNLTGGSGGQASDGGVMTMM